METTLVNLENYGPYLEFVKTGKQLVDINKEFVKETWKNHYDSILNILKDGIDTDFVQSNFINIKFNNGFIVDLAIIDYWLNLIMWSILVRTDTTIEPKHIFFEKEFKKNSIKNYVDKFFIESNRKKFSNRELNNIIDDMMHLYKAIDEFAMYLGDTINLEDSIFMMDKNEEFYNLLHADFSGIPIEDNKDVGLALNDRMIEMMKYESHDILGYDHCFADAWKASEGINPRQHKEYAISVGSKPDGKGGVFPVAINNSLINGGLDNPIYYFIESHSSRTALILMKMNVGNSGQFGRILGLNNMDTRLHPDPDYICNTKNLIKIEITNKDFLGYLNNRYYKIHPEGIEFIINSKTDFQLIGKTIYLRSPMTCASHARGEGICYRCFGDLAYTVRDVVNIGRLGTELLSSVLIQILLSAKHLLETVIEKIVWTPKFSDLFYVEGNMISISQDLEFQKGEYKLLINPEDLSIEDADEDTEDDEDDLDKDSEEFSYDPLTEYAEYITEFEVLHTPTGEIFTIYGEKGENPHNNTKIDDKKENLYISKELNTVIRSSGKPLNGRISIDFNDIVDHFLFSLYIQNNDLTKTLTRLENLLNKGPVIKGLDKDQWMQAVIEAAIAGGLRIASIYLEIIMSNQIRNVDHILEKPQWEYPNEPYELLSLNTALSNNPSITISLSFQNIAKMLYNPLSFKKNGVSFMDLFFMEQPQNYKKSMPESNDNIEKDDNGLPIAIEYFNK